VQLGSPNTRAGQETSDPADPAEDKQIMWVDSNGDLKIKINHGGSVKTATIIDFSTL